MLRPAMNAPISPRTIRNRVLDLLGKLGASSREEAVTMAQAAGFSRP
jgi:DNA-binding CsgD family transcriptional regulator